MSGSDTRRPGGALRDVLLRAEVAAHPYPLLFATVSGAHLYGFASPDSDVDLRGAHVVPTVFFAGLDRVHETVKSEHVRDGVEIDLVTHEVRKFCRLLLRNNGYVLEQLYSPLVVHTTPEHQELMRIARGCITRSCVRHYLGFAANQWLLFEKGTPRRVKPLLYVFRVLLSGVHMMRTGQVNASLPECNAALDAERLAWIDELIEVKTTGAERGTIGGERLEFYEQEYQRWRERLSDEAARSTLPEEPTAEPEMRDFLWRIRAGRFSGQAENTPAGTTEPRR
ncbi:MAG TPA: nucleotidyltransferase domain-containing protein [Gemmatimonadaceae bacterium]|nr:nucleotidyltransferase domain-containing protein [Gemmatimonadaceae bacterium]